MSAPMEWLEDWKWAARMWRAKRHRRKLGFSERMKFDGALRPIVDGMGAVIDYPDALYHARGHDVDRAIKAAEARS